MFACRREVLIGKRAISVADQQLVLPLRVADDDVRRLPFTSPKAIGNVSRLPPGRS